MEALYLLGIFVCLFLCTFLVLSLIVERRQTRNTNG